MKGLLESKTVWGVLVALLGSFASRYGVDVCGADTTATAGDIATLAGSALAIYGRVRAVTGIAGLIGGRRDAS